MGMKNSQKISTNPFKFPFPLGLFYAIILTSVSMVKYRREKS
jgi:hypothetical protein